MATASIDSLLIEGATVVTSFAHASDETTRRATKRGFVNVCHLPNGIEYHAGKTRHGKSPMTRQASRAMLTHGQ